MKVNLKRTEVFKIVKNESRPGNKFGDFIKLNKPLQNLGKYILYYTQYLPNMASQS